MKQQAVRRPINCGGEVQGEVRGHVGVGALFQRSYFVIKMAVCLIQPGIKQASPSRLAIIVSPAAASPETAEKPERVMIIG
eukprot:COSAG05_NODE_87_length_20404_cov_42.272051_16_plen_81_part_00